MRSARQVCKDDLIDILEALGVRPAGHGLGPRRFSVEVGFSRREARERRRDDFREACFFFDRLRVAS